MARSPEVSVNPALLRWARDEAAMPIELVARRVGTKPERVEAWELGERRPSLIQLKKLAAAYARPPAFFFLAKPPASSVPHVMDYRSPEPQPEAHPKTRGLVLRSLQRRDAYLSLDEDVPRFGERFESYTDRLGAAAAEYARTVLDVSIEDQFGANDQYVSLRLWIASFERHGILVFQASDLGLPDMRGLSLFFDLAPIILLRGKDTPTGRVFTLVHELGHLLLRRNALCDPYQYADARVEIECNRFAADLLMPAPTFRREVHSGSLGADPLDVAIGAGRSFGVSAQAAAIRMVTLDLATDDLIERAARYTADAMAARAEQQAASGGFVPHHVLRLRDLGRLYTSTVIEAYHTDRIGLTDAVQYLGVKAPTFARMEAALPTAELERSS